MESYSISTSPKVSDDPPFMIWRLGVGNVSNGLRVGEALTNSRKSRAD